MISAAPMVNTMVAAVSILRIDGIADKGVAPGELCNPCGQHLDARQDRIERRAECVANPGRRDTNDDDAVLQSQR